MKNLRILAIALSAAAVAGAGCDVQRRSSSSVQTLEPSAVIPSMLGSWSSQSTQSITTLPGAPASCGAFQWNITTQTDTAIVGSFTATCSGGVTISGNANGQINELTMNITVNGSANLAGSPNCSFSLSGTGIMEGDTIRIPYTGSTCLGPVSGTQTLRRSYVQPNVPAPAPTPAPAPAPTPTPTPPPSAGPDQLDMRNATILNSPRDLASWTISTLITQVDISQNGVHVEFSKRLGSGRWPDVFPPGWDEPLQYTLGMCLNISARWYCSAAIQFWHPLEASGGPPQDFAHNWFYDPARWGPMTGHQPAVGETIGFFVCEGDCRNNLTGTTSPLRERSNVVLLPMPGYGGGSWRF
jgi:hypothetical protein